VKLYVSTVFGSTPKELHPAERWVWVGFLALAGDSQWDGVIKATVTLGYSDDQLADLLFVDLPTLRAAKKKMIKAEKIIVDENGIISIVNWQKYQSEYDRQKKYRAKSYVIKLLDEVTGTSYSLSCILNSSISSLNSSLKWDGITDKDKEAWKKAYPACDVELELLKMIEWIKANPAKGKKSNYRRFITGWLSRQQDKGGSFRGQPGQQKSPTEKTREWAQREMEKEAAKKGAA